MNEGKGVQFNDPKAQAAFVAIIADLKKATAEGIAIQKQLGELNAQR